jgi:hypothetical protein
LDAILLLMASALISEDFNGQFGAAKEWDAGSFDSAERVRVVSQVRVLELLKVRLVAQDCSERAKGAFELPDIIFSAEWR